MATDVVGKNKPAGKAKASGSWQAQKSAMTRDRILNAAIDCFIQLGYANVTTAKVADFSGVSRGAMLHHFPSKNQLIQAAVEYLHNKLLADYSDRISKVPTDISVKARNQAGIEAYWEHLSSDLFTAYHELSVSGRTDPALQKILQESIIRFDEHVAETNARLFSEWQGKGEKFLLAMDVTKFLMEGMAVGQIIHNREKRIRRLLDYLSDCLEEIFLDDEESTISRHSQP